MPIRNSKVMSDDAFTVHREARLKNYQKTPAPGPVEQSAKHDETELPEKSTSDPDRPDKAEQPTPVQPSKETRAAKDQVESEPAASVKPETSVSSHSKAVTPKKKPDGDASKIRLNMTLAHPAGGTCPTFDHIAKVEGEQVAFRLVMGKALEAYAEMARNRGVEEAPRTYAESSAVAITSRMFPKDAYDELVAALNPTGLISKRLMGNTIGRRALAAFVAQDNKKN